MSDIKKIKKILGHKLKNNDINLVDTIMSYIVCECHACGEKKDTNDCLKVFHENNCDLLRDKWRCDECAYKKYWFCPDVCLECDGIDILSSITL